VTAAPAVDAAWIERTFEETKNWGRWGDDDQRGALNLITPERVAAAATLVREGAHISCALDLDTVGSAENPAPAQHHMLIAGDATDEPLLPGLEQTTDYISVACHGAAVSHLDALCHMAVRGLMYNGVPVSEVRSTGARHLAVTAIASGICSRGVLLDVPAARGVEWLGGADRIVPEDLEEAERQHGVEVGPGDILLVSIGRSRHRRAQAEPLEGGMPGLHPTCIPWLRERDIAVLGSDGFSDAFGADMVPMWPVPIHQCVIAGMGVPLLDNLDLVDLADACAARRQWQFFFVVAPLRIPRGTGCAVNPIAVF
jgi:kynurenine formamidase